MSQESLEIAKFSPYKLVQDYAETPVWKYTVIAVVIHIVVIGATSIGYIANWGKPLQTAAVQPAGGAAPTNGTTATPTAAGSGPSTTSARPADGLTPTAASDTDPMKQHQDTKIIKAITETAKPEDIPAGPDDLGISIKDTEQSKKK